MRLFASAPLKAFTIAALIGLASIPALESMAANPFQIPPFLRITENNGQDQQPERSTGRRSYLMTCRGGDNMDVILRTAGKDAMIFNFEKAPRSATAAPIEPGQCAWQDRPIHRDEPNKLIYRIPPGNDTGLNLTFNVATNKLTDLEIVSRGDNSPQQLIKNIRSGQPFFVQAQRTEDGNSFLITKIGL